MDRFDWTVVVVRVAGLVLVVGATVQGLPLIVTALASQSGSLNGSQGIISLQGPAFRLLVTVLVELVIGVALFCFAMPITWAVDQKTGSTG